MKKHSIRPALPADAEMVGQLVGALFNELRGLPDTAASELDTRLVRKLLGMEDQVFGFLLQEDDEVVGIIMLGERNALYAGGTYGVITELYVHPNKRSHGLAQLLMTKAEEFARNRGWTMLEVGAPSVPKWQRSVSFYTSVGFHEVGPRLRKRLE
ncbi:GNAT family N-acetyltransferase [Leeia oryzae]|uniref:GNAT family N-acetyltransferase n=1 Tax=Leeia oryzae TaxID=356662 RepID=UPI0003A6983A|nr:GNAT family N-acetyltransferase [Leeia oryzae]